MRGVSSDYTEIKVTPYQVLLLAAGEGRRLRPLTERVPKCLVPILGRPLLSYWLELFASGPRPSAVWINTCYLAASVEEYLSTEGKNYEVSIRILRENELQGTAGTLKNFLDGIQVNKELLLAHADNLSWFDLSEFLRAHETRPTQAEITMMTFETDNPESCGIVELNDQNMIEQFHEKKTNAPGTTASGAVFLLSKKAQMEIKGMTKRVDFSAQILPHFLDKIYTWKNTCYHRDIGEPTSYKKAEIEFDLIRKIKK